MPRKSPTTPGAAPNPGGSGQAPAERTYEIAPLPGLPASLLDTEALCSALESLLFIAGRPVELTELRKLLAVDEKRLREGLRALEAECEAHNRGIRLLSLGESVQFVSAPENARFVAALLGLPTQARLTTAALETLAVVAYRQPMTRAQIEAIRGVNSDRALASLLQHGLVFEVGRGTGVGRPALFGTTPEFLQQFGLGSLEALPKPDLPEFDALEAARSEAADRIREAVSQSDAEAASTEATSAGADENSAE